MSVPTSDFPFLSDAAPVADDDTLLDAGTDVETDLDDDGEVDLSLDDDGDEDEGDGAAATQTAKPEAGAASTKARSGPNKAHVRRVAAKVVQLQDADGSDLQVLASLYGVEADAVEVTVAIMTSDRSALTAVRDLSDIASASDPFEAMVTAQERGRARMRAVHDLLGALGQASDKSLTANDAKAAMSVARDASKLSEQATQVLGRVLELARRTA